MQIPSFATCYLPLYFCHFYLLQRWCGLIFFYGMTPIAWTYSIYVSMWVTCGIISVLSDMNICLTCTLFFFQICDVTKLGAIHKKNVANLVNNENMKMIYLISLFKNYLLESCIISYNFSIKTIWTLKKKFNSAIFHTPKNGLNGIIYKYWIVISCMIKSLKIGDTHQLLYMPNCL